MSQLALDLPPAPGDSRWSPPTDFPRWWDAKSVVVDVETRDPTLQTRGPGWAFNEGEVVGIALECDGDARYYPIAHHGGGNVDAAGVWRYVNDICRADNTKVFHNALYDVGWLTHHGVLFDGKIRDTSFSAALLDEHRFTYSLEALTSDAGLPTKDESALQAYARRNGLDPKADLWRMPASAVGAYGEGDVRATRALYEHHRPLVVAEDLSGVEELECALVPMLIDMRLRGLRIDQERAAKLKVELRHGIAELQKRLRDEWRFRGGSKEAKAIGAVCSREGIPFARTPKTKQPSFKKEFFQDHPHPFIQMIAQLRSLETLQGLLKGIVYEYMYEGRIHCELHPLRRERSDGGRAGTVSGRFSSSGPNLQQVPERDLVWGPRFRGLFIGEDGYPVVKADYSEQEYRLGVHDAVRLGYPGARDAAVAYEKKGASFHDYVAELTGLDRKPAKNVNFGIIYGMGIAKTALVLGVSEEEAIRILDTYKRHIPFMKPLAWRASKQAEDVGYVRTMLGRRAHFPDRDEETGRVLGAHKALNRRIQGSGADMIKKAMLDCNSEGLQPALQVHDELVFTTLEAEKAPRVEELMECAIVTFPRMRVEAKVGPNWGEEFAVAA